MDRQSLSTHTHTGLAGAGCPVFGNGGANEITSPNYVVAEPGRVRAQIVLPDLSSLTILRRRSGTGKRKWANDKVTVQASHRSSRERAPTHERKLAGKRGRKQHMSPHSFGRGHVKIRVTPLRRFQKVRRGSREEEGREGLVREHGPVGSWPALARPSKVENEASTGAPVRIF